MHDPFLLSRIALPQTTGNRALRLYLLGRRFLEEQGRPAHSLIPDGRLEIGGTTKLIEITAPAR